jgi:hypothetical protein
VAEALESLVRDVRPNLSGVIDHPD